MQKWLYLEYVTRTTRTTTTRTTSTFKLIERDARVENALEKLFNELWDEFSGFYQLYL